MQALNTQQNEFNLRLEAMTTTADNDRAALVEAQRSVTHWHNCHLLLLLAWSVCCLHSLAQHVKSPHTLLSLSCSALLKYGRGTQLNLLVFSQLYSQLQSLLPARSSTSAS